MNAFIFAAGKGTRLKDITSDRPKALVEVNGKPMLVHAIEKVIDSGATRIIINVHHFAQKVIDYIKTLNYNNVEIKISDESDLLLDTGGALVFAKNLFIPDEPILLFNVDILTNANLKELINQHLENKALATLLVMERDTSRYLLFNEQNNLCGWENIKTNEIIFSNQKCKYKRLAFSGIHVINYEMINMLGQVGVFSITPKYIELAKNNVIKYRLSKNEYWFDIGTPEKLEKAKCFFEK